jgi:outer membrane protein assembly factor BamB
MKSKRLLFFSIVVLTALFLSGCGARTVSNWPALSSDGANIYLADGLQVYIVDTVEGREHSLNLNGTMTPVRFPQKANSSELFFGAPALTADGQIIVGSITSKDHSLFSITPFSDQVPQGSETTYRQNWIFIQSKGGWVAGPLVLNEMIYLGDSDGTLYAFTLKGDLKWTFEKPEHGLWATPATDGTTLFVTSLDHFVYAINPQDGSELWSAELDGAILGTPAVSDGKLYVGTLSQSVYAIDAAQGSILWQKQVNGWMWGGPVIDQGTLYFGTIIGQQGGGGTLYALNAADGSVAWTRDEAGAILASPLVLSDQIVYGTELGLVQSLDKNGKPLWQATLTDAQIYTSPLAVGDLIVIAPMNNENFLYAYDHNGVQKWAFKPLE